MYSKCTSIQIKMKNYLLLKAALVTLRVTASTFMVTGSACLLLYMFIYFVLFFNIFCFFNPRHHFFPSPLIVRFLFILLRTFGYVSTHCYCNTKLRINRLISLQHKYCTTTYTSLPMFYSRYLYSIIESVKS